MSRRQPQKQAISKTASSDPENAETGFPCAGTFQEDEENRSLACAANCSYLNSNDLGPKRGGGLASIYLTFASSYKREQSDPKPSHAVKTGEPGRAGRSQSSSRKITTEVETDDELSLESKYLLCSYVFNDIIGCDFTYVSPFGKTLATYLDYVASGRSLKCIEHYIRQYVMPTYSNTHTDVNYIAQQTTKLREEAREIIRECVNGSEDDAVIFTGSGSTAAINKLIDALNIKPMAKEMSLIVFVGPYEHHSNILPWREVATKVITIRPTENGLLDLDNLKLQLEIHTKCTCRAKHLLIGSFSAASNVTGILTDVNSVAVLMHNYGGYAFFDYACAAPYTDIDMNPPIPDAYKDAVFISPHKFIGGPQTPGILVAKKWAFRNSVPHGVGGGTVIFVRRTAHTYASSVEHREEGGTPGIIESIRAGLVFKLKAAFTPKFIMDREQEMCKAAKSAWSRLPNLLILGNIDVQRLPIFPMLFMNQETGRLLHHDFIARILNDVFGIQARSGCACAGPYGMDLLGVKEKVGHVFEKIITVKANHCETGSSTSTRTKNVIFKPGYVRLNFPFFIPDDCLNFTLKAIQMTSEKGWVLLPLYNYDRHSGAWWFRLQSDFVVKRSLDDVTFISGQFGLKKTNRASCICKTGTDNGDMSKSLLDMTASEANNYDEILARAELIFTEAETVDQFDICDTTAEFTPEEESLRWFMLPSEAADIINNREVRHVLPEQLPFLPTSMKEKLCSRRS